MVAILTTLLSFLQTYALFFLVVLVFGLMGLWQVLKGRLRIAVILALLVGAVVLVRAIRP